MSNLLSSLIARTTETADSAGSRQADILQPRPRALFETETPAAMPSLPTENLETAEFTPAAQQLPTLAKSRRRQPDVSIQIEPKPAVPKQPSPKYTPASQPPAPPSITVVSTPSPEKTAVSAPKPASDQPNVQPVVVETLPVREQPVLRPHIQRITPKETAVSPPRSADVSSLKTKNEPPQAADQEQTRTIRLDPPIPSLPKIEAPAAKTRPDASPTTIITNLIGPKAVPMRPEAIIPTQTVPYIQAEQKRPFTDPTSPEPFIQVHIGRIEVRATQAETAPSPKKQRQLPVMGLDDYLRQRNGRGGKP